MTGDDVDRFERWRPRLGAIAYRLLGSADEALAYVRAGNPRYTESLLRHRVEHGLKPLPGGGEVRISSKDPEAIRAIHAFMAFQRGDHRAGGEHR